ncbi:hypothetical protein PM033_16685 [Halorubrum ezzemoulense]|uniref:hypothetical protein n=1 Tax=Halorubrum ezzemoulense TaxID=337243 RepID=UPI00232F37F1|nr:hypothetical protein [Halorubrum ezzemoulense]MDB2253371.1 hypothetical protein [Halorubrum ezzemoulense]
MKLNRRSVLGAIGLVGVGTGAAFGSGAFTSTTANRAVEVNILGGADYDSGSGVIEDAGDTAEGNIATEITETVGIDVLVDITSPNVSVESRTGSISDVETLFPQSDVGYDSLDTAYSDGSTNYVSLVANDVRVVFGADGNNEGLPASSTVEFADLFAFGRTNSSAGPDVKFETGSPSAAAILTDLNNNSGTNGDPSSGVTFSGPSSGNLLDADVATGTNDDATQPLNITIDSAN